MATRLDQLNEIAENRKDVPEAGGVSLRDALEGQDTLPEEVSEEEIKFVEAENEDEEIEDEEVEEEITAPVYEKDGEWVTKIRVDGEDLEVPFDQLKRSAQRDAASAARFEAAAQKEQQARKLMEEYNAMSVEEPSIEEEGEDGADFKDMAKELVEALNYGEEDDAVEKMAAVLKNTKGGNNYDASELDRIVEERLSARLEQRNADQLQVRIEAAQARWDSEYEDIGKDEFLRDVAKSKAQRLFAENPDRDPYDVMAEAGNFVRGKLKDGFATPVLPTSDEMAARAEKKRALDNVSASSARAATSGQDEAPSASQVINELRKLRGQRY